MQILRLNGPGVFDLEWSPLQTRIFIILAKKKLVFALTSTQIHLDKSALLSGSCREKIQFVFSKTFGRLLQREKKLQSQSSTVPTPRFPSGILPENAGIPRGDLLRERPSADLWNSWRVIWVPPQRQGSP